MPHADVNRQVLYKDDEPLDGRDPRHPDSRLDEQLLQVITSFTLCRASHASAYEERRGRQPERLALRDISSEDDATPRARRARSNGSRSGSGHVALRYGSSRRHARSHSRSRHRRSRSRRSRSSRRVHDHSSGLLALPPIPGGLHASPAQDAEGEPPRQAAPDSLIAAGSQCEALRKLVGKDKAHGRKAGGGDDEGSDHAHEGTPRGGGRPRRKASIADATATAPSPKPPTMPKDKQQVQFLGGSIRAKDEQTKFTVRVPRKVCRDNREVVVDRQYGQDKAAAYKGCLEKIKSLVSRED